MRTSHFLLRIAAIALCCLIASLVGTGEARQAKGKKYALLVGVNEYDSSKFTPLKYTENDVEKLAKLLIDKGGFESKNVRVLTNKRGKRNDKDAPTAANIKLAFEDLALREEQARHRSGGVVRPRRTGGSRRSR